MSYPARAEGLGKYDNLDRHYMSLNKEIKPNQYIIKNMKEIFKFHNVYKYIDIVKKLIIQDPKF